MKRRLLKMNLKSKNLKEVSPSKEGKVDNVTNLGSMRRLPGTADKKKSPTQQRTEERKEQQNTKKVADIFTNIKRSLSSINKTIKDQLKLIERDLDLIEEERRIIEKR